MTQLAQSHVLKANAFDVKGDSSSLEGQTITFHEADGKEVEVKLSGSTYGEMLENLKMTLIEIARPSLLHW